jgi:multidrug efflux pump
MIAPFFIDRPIFASVLSILITLIGGIALATLPIAQYPRITPPGVSIIISYPGASAPVVADTVAAPIEQQVNGIEGMLYMSSQMGNDGSYSLTVTFDIDTDLNTALVMVQNRVALAMPQLPTAVQNQGITIRKRTPDILMIVNFFSPDDRYNDIYLSNYATIHVRDELLRVPGVADVNYMGQRDCSIRAWLDPQKLASRGMTAMDVADAIRSQNLDAPAGQVGQPPVAVAAPFQLPIDTLGRLSEPEQFGAIIVKASLPPPTAPAGAAAPASGRSSTTPVGASSFLQVGGGATSGTTTQASTAGRSLNATLPLAPPAPPDDGSGSSGSTGGATAGGPATIASTGTASTTGGGVTTTAAGTTTGGAASSTGGATNPMPLNTGVGGAARNGVIGGATMGRGPGPPAVSIVRLRDVARVELGAQNYNQACTFDGHASVGLSVYQLPGTNALDVADRVRARMKELESRFPDGIAYDIAYDITPFIRESVADVVKTLLEAVLLVGLVVLVFLQSWRAVLIPLVAVPVAIVGTFAVMAVLGFSLNNISLFGLVLAIGIVVDDAIVVVENVERWLERGLPPREATRKAMEEVTGPVIAVALVLCAVFVPCALISGITGQFFRQFAVTIAVSTVFSAINSLTLSPALAAILLRPRGGRRDPLAWLLDRSLGWFFRGFNRGFNASTTGYVWVVGKMLRINVVVLLAYGGLVALTYVVFVKAPTGFVPQQDQGRLIVNVQLPDSASLQRTIAAMAQIEAITHEVPGVAHTVTISGLSFLQQATSANFGSMFVVLDPFDRRQRPELRAEAIMARLRRAYPRRVKEAVVTVFGAAPVPGLGVAGGFKLMVEDRSGLGLANLQRQTDELTRLLKSEPGLAGVTTQFRSNAPQLFLDIDRAKAQSLGLSFDDVNQTLSMYLGSLYVNSFNQFGRHWQVTVQADGHFRDRIEDINLFQVRNQRGGMVPLGTLVYPREVGGPIFVTRYNLSAAANITGNLLPGASTGEAIARINALAARTLPLSMKTEWTELMFMQIRAGNTAMYVFALAVVSVFLALAALYESWSLPLAVILVVPLCLLCSVAGVLYTHRDVNIFVQIGLVVLVGLACKNAILIVEFARRKHAAGAPRYDATREACQLRLRPILMTSFAFVFGVIPLVVASGAGAEMRRSLGTAVFSGMLGVTLFGIFLTPVFYYVIEGLGETRLFTAEAMHWVGSPLLGALTGSAMGYLLLRLEVTHAGWAPLIGGCAGALAALALVGAQHALTQRSEAAGGFSDSTDGEGGARHALSQRPDAAGGLPPADQPTGTQRGEPRP